MRPARWAQPGGHGTGEHRSFLRVGLDAARAGIIPRVATDPSGFTRWVVTHPVLWSLISGAAVFAIALRTFEGAYWEVWLIASVAFALLTYALWRSGGLGHRVRAYMLRRFPKK